MTEFRRYCLAHPALAALLILAALAMKLLVPAGFMPIVGSDTITVQLCSGTGPMMMEMPAPAPTDDSEKHKQSKADMPCAYSGLSASFLSAVDPILLAVAISFILALAPRLSTLPLFSASARLRPPLRAPPLPA